MTSNPRIRRSPAHTLALIALAPLLTGCGAALQRRVDVHQPSGADSSIDERFGLTADAQDPTQRDNELGYGRWKAKPEPTGTVDPRSSTRRGETWTPGQ
ncbi:MAG: hypothetical protein KC996_01345 [Phycisphaerales bacterium]|nr:hypothetical protein [Phycisphaerales bacterium]